MNNGVHWHRPCFVLLQPVNYWYRPQLVNRFVEIVINYQEVFGRQDEWISVQMKRRGESIVQQVYHFLSIIIHLILSRQWCRRKTTNTTKIIVCSTSTKCKRGCVRSLELNTSVFPIITGWISICAAIECWKTFSNSYWWEWWSRYGSKDWTNFSFSFDFNRQILHQQWEALILLPAIPKKPWWMNYHDRRWRMAFVFPICLSPLYSLCFRDFRTEVQRKCRWRLVDKCLRLLLNP